MEKNDVRWAIYAIRCPTLQFWSMSFLSPYKRPCVGAPEPTSPNDLLQKVASALREK